MLSVSVSSVIIIMIIANDYDNHSNNILSPRYKMMSLIQSVKKVF